MLEHVTATADPAEWKQEDLTAKVKGETTEPMCL